MRLVTSVLLDAFPMHVINIHPALLPAFPGLHAQRQALEHGTKITGATVHFVDDGTDTGPIIVQSAVPVLATDDLEALQQRILRTEHQIYPLALRWAVEGRLQVEGRQVSVKGAPPTFLWSGD
jgi:phosphoribosylglycinamide formyltransferase-1